MGGIRKNSLLCGWGGSGRIHYCAGGGDQEEFTTVRVGGIRKNSLLWGWGGSGRIHYCGGGGGEGSGRNHYWCCVMPVHQIPWGSSPDTPPAGDGLHGHV